MIVSILRAVLFAGVVFPALLIVQLGFRVTGQIYATALVAFALMLTSNAIADAISEERLKARARDRRPHP